MKLHENDQEFKDAVQAAAQHFKTREVFVEKDYWVTFVLKNLYKSTFSNKVVFKGGTSISKGYGIAKRFSEDIDLAIISNGESKEEAGELLEALERILTVGPFEENRDQRLAPKRKTFLQSHWSYPKKLEGMYDPAKDKIMLEITNIANTFPHSRMSIKSLIADFLDIQSFKDEIDRYDLQSFEINVLSIKRTFAEKVVAIANASHADKDHSKLKDKIRHLYDLTILIEDAEIKEFINSGEFTAMISEAQAGDLLIPGVSETAKLACHSALIFTDSNETLAKLKDTYENGLGPLVFDRDSMPSLTDVENMLKVVTASLTKG